MTSAVFHRRLRTPAPIEAVGGDGVYVIDREGRRYLDASSGSGVSCLGHSDVNVRAAMAQQLGRLAFAHTGFFTNAPMEELAENLISDAPPGLSYVWFASGGAEAMEAALKLVHQYFAETGESRKRYIIGRRGGYLGSTLGALAAGGNAARREPFEALLFPHVRHIGPCFPYRGMAPGETEESYGKRAAEELEALIAELGAEQVAAFVAETIVGSTSGAVAPAAGYYRHVRAICDRHKILLVLDEVMCGLGRTGARFACAQEGVAPDLIVLAKGLAAGYAPLGAVLVSRAIHEAIKLGSGSFRHGLTAHGHALACAAGLAVQREIAARGLIANVNRQGAALKAALKERFGEHPHVGDIRGRGLMLALELVADRERKTPFDPALQLHARLKARAFERGLICYPSGGTIDGRSGDHVMAMPPFILEASHIEELVDKLSGALEASLADIAG